MKYLFGRLVKAFMIILIGSNGQIYAGNCEPTLSVTEVKVTFGGENYSLTSDAGQAITGPHYEQEGNKSKPIAYMKWTKPSVEMTFKMEMDIPYGEECSAVIQAIGPDDMLFEESGPIDLENGNNEYTYDMTTADREFPDEIRLYGPGKGTFDLKWQIKFDDEEKFEDIHTSKHRIYLTAGVPSVQQETLFYYACNKPSGNDGSDGKAVTHLIWGDFSRNMARIDSDSGDLRSETLLFNYHASVDLLKTGHGVCNSWAKFFKDVLAVHGYPSTYVHVRTNPSIMLPSGIHVPGAFWFVAAQDVKDGTDPPTIDRKSVV